MEIQRAGGETGVLYVSFAFTLRPSFVALIFGESEGSNRLHTLQGGLMNGLFRVGLHRQDLYGNLSICMEDALTGGTARSWEGVVKDT
jgi:hypothetical protein